MMRKTRDDGRPMADYACWHSGSPEHACGPVKVNGSEGSYSFTKRPVGLAQDMIAEYSRDRMYRMSGDDSTIHAYALANDDNSDPAVILINTSSSDKTVSATWPLAIGKSITAECLRSTAASPSLMDNNEDVATNVTIGNDPVLPSSVSANGAFHVFVPKYSAVGLKFE